MMDTLLLLTRKHDPWCKKVEAVLRASHGDRLTVRYGYVGDRGFPEDLLSWEGDVLISYMTPWIVPQSVLHHARKFAINFHSGPPEYPGIGVYNFALYDGADTFGVTCHHMTAKVDSGDIIDVRSFPVTPRETVASLRLKAMKHLFQLFHSIMEKYVRGEHLPHSALAWSGRTHTRKQLNALCHITPDMSDAEVMRRVRATYYPGAPGSYIERAGYRFELKQP